MNHYSNIAVFDALALAVAAPATARLTTLAPIKYAFASMERLKLFKIDHPFILLWPSRFFRR